MNSNQKILILSGILVLVCLTAIGYEYHDTVPDPLKGYNWKEAAKERGFTQKDIKRLEKEKILITNETFKQVFDPYVESDIPVFITSDSLLNAFHVLYEESVMRMEKANSKKLPEILKFIWKNLETVDSKIKGKPELVKAAKTRAQVTIGTAIKLLGDDSIKPDKSIEKLINEEVKRIEASTGNMKPEWLGPPDPGFLGLDYSRYKPRGFYTQSEELKRYFRAVSWLQSIPFRVSKDEELLSIIMLGSSLKKEGSKENKKPEDYFFIFSCYESFIGTGDDWNLTDIFELVDELLDFNLEEIYIVDDEYSSMFEYDEFQKYFKDVIENYTKEDYLGAKRKYLIKFSKGAYTKYGYEDQEINDQLRFAPDDPSRVAEPSFRIISAYRTPDALMFQRTTDTRKFKDRGFPDGLEICTALGSEYARSILLKKEGKELIEAIDEIKKVIKPQILYAKGSLYLEYLHSLEALLDEPEPDAPVFMSGEPWKIKSCQTVLAGWSQLRHTWALQAKQNILFIGMTENYPGFVEPEPEFFKRMADLFERTERLLRESGAFDPELRGSIPADPRGMTFQEGPDIEELWRELIRVSRRLEALAHKQLRGVPLSKDENVFISSYGHSIGRIMLYEGNAFLSPNDDAPRIIDVFHNPITGGYMKIQKDINSKIAIIDSVSGYLEVGIGRPRAIYVLYPVKGGEIFCLGALMPYYEFRHSDRLTDEEWRKLLDKKKMPEQPDWIKPIKTSTVTKVP